jgi:uncharacterized protein (DUF697 family)
MDTKKEKANAPEENTVNAEAETRNLPDETQRKLDVDKIIRKKVYVAMGAGVVIIPVINFASVLGIQLKLVKDLCEYYGVEFKKNVVKKIITTVITSGASVLGSQVLETAVVGVPVVGLPIAVGSKAITGGLTTYAVGMMFVTHFEKGGTLAGDNWDNMKESFKKAMAKSRNWLADVLRDEKMDEVNATA